VRLAFLDWGIIVFYAVFMLAVGLTFSRRASRSVADFFVSGRRLAWWVAGTSMVATTFAADTPLFVTSLIRCEGVAGNWVWFNFAISHALTTFFLARLWRRARVVTDVEFCEMRYSGPEGRALRCFKGAFFAFVTNSVVLGWVLLAMATICEEVMGLPKLQTIAAGVVLATLYATVSGLWGVVATDLIQFAAAMVGSVVLMIKAFDAVGGIGGFSNVLPTLLAENGRAAMEILPDLTGRPAAAAQAAGSTLGGFLTAVGVQWWSWKYSDGGGVLIQRMSATRDERHSQLAMLWFTFANYVLRPWPWFMVALISLYIFPELTDHKAAYPRMMAEFLGPGWLGLMMAAILAAFMSTVDTHINLASAYFVNDVYRRFLRPGAGEGHYVLVARLATLMFLVIGGLIALFNTSIVRLFVFMLQLVAGAGIVFLVRWFWWRINAWSEISAMLSSLVVATLLNLCNRHHWIGRPFAAWEIFLINVGLSAAVWLTVTFCTRPTDLGHLRAFVARVRPPGYWGPVAAGGAEPLLRGKRLEGFILTVVLVYAGLIGLGHLLYGKIASGTALCLAGAAATVRVLFILRKERNGPLQT